MVDNFPRKMLFSKPCRAFTPNMRDVPMHMRYKKYCMIFTHFHACMYHFHKIAYYSTRKINHAIEICFSRFPTQKTVCITNTIFTPKTACYLMKNKTSKLGFLSSFPIKISACITTISPTKQHVINQEYNTCKLKIFPAF